MIRHIAIILLLNFSLQFGGYQLYFSVTQFIIQKENRSEFFLNLQKEKSIHFQFPIDSKVQFKNDHEFVLNGQIYDVLSQSTQNGIVYLECYYDQKETKLWSYFESFVDLLFGKALDQIKKVLETIETSEAAFYEVIYCPIKWEYHFLINVFLSFSSVSIYSIHLFSIFQPPEAI